MHKQIEAIRKGRFSLLVQLNELSDEQLNKIPEGFKNNIAWNLGHMITVQQGICYKRAGLTTMIGNDFWERFKPGSRPEGMISIEEIAHIKYLLLSTLEQFATDYDQQIFGNYVPMSALNGMELTDINGGIRFLAFHEEFHSGAIMAIKRAIGGGIK
jgi:DinB superfamily